MIADQLILIGDSAGLAYPQSGEGIRPAIESALFAAQTLKDVQGEFSMKQLQAYQDKMEQRFGKRQPGTGIMARMPDTIRVQLARKLLTSKLFAKHVVMDRWFLHQHQPPVRVQ